MIILMVLNGDQVLIKNNNDIAHYTNLRLGTNLGNLRKELNHCIAKPIDAVYDDIAALKQKLF
jgi:hypothetical protein